MFNRAQRQRRRIVIAERRMTPQGYLTVHLRSVDGIDPRKSGNILGVFKHTTQAKEFLEEAVKQRRLCPVLLGVEPGRKAADEVNRDPSIENRRSTLARIRPCFSYHLGRCAGACVGEELPEAYNARVEEAFEARKVVAWPYGGPLVIRERRQRLALSASEGSGARGQRSEADPERRRGVRGQRSDSEELFLVDNWVLVGSLTKTGGRYAPLIPGSHRFDYDTYKIILAFVHPRKNERTVRSASPSEWKRLVRSASVSPQSETLSRASGD